MNWLKETGWAFALFTGGFAILTVEIGLLPSMALLMILIGYNSLTIPRV